MIKSNEIVSPIIKSSIGDRKRLISNFFYLSFIQFANYLLPLLTLPYLIKTLGMDKYGLISFAVVFLNYFKVISDYGFNLSATREVSVFRNDKKKLQEIYSSVLSIKISLMIIGFIILLFLVFFIPKFKNDSLLYILSFGSVIGFNLFPVWFFQGIEKMKYVTFFNVFSKVIFTIAIFLFVKSPNDYHLVPILTSLGFIISGFASLFIIHFHFKIRFSFQRKRILWIYLTNGWNIFVTDFMPNMYNNFSVFFVGFFVNFEELGYYALAAKIIDVLNNFIGILRNTTYPYLARDNSKFKKIAKITIGAGICLTLLVFLIAPTILPLIFGDKLNRSLIYFYILGFSPMLLAISYTFGNNKLLVLRKDKEMKNITFKSSIAGFILALISIPILGAIGAAITLVFTRGLRAFLVCKKSSIYKNVGV